MNVPNGRKKILCTHMHYAYHREILYGWTQHEMSIRCERCAITFQFAELLVLVSICMQFVSHCFFKVPNQFQLFTIVDDKNCSTYNPSIYMAYNVQLLHLIFPFVASHTTTTRYDRNSENWNNLFAVYRIVMNERVLTYWREVSTSELFMQRQ